MAAKGTTEVEDIKYIQRGYESIVEKLKKIGADIKYVVEKDTEEMPKIV